ncbi:MAG: hypothetical protein ACJ790_20605 [Myxococcaceae bacterium]
MKRLLIFALSFGVFFGCKNQLDDEKPRLYKCDRDGGEACPGGWTCGLEGYCHSPDAEGAFKCEHSSDCGGGWHCGVRGVCYAPTTTTEPCRQDAGVGEGSDCAEGFRCGLESTCHPSNVAGPYKCESDSDCESGWRCAQDKVCVDVAGQALDPHANTVSNARLSPLLPTDAEQVAMTPSAGYSSGANLALAWSRGSTVSVFLAGASDLSNVQQFDVTLPAPPTSLALVTDYVFASGPFGVVRVSPQGDAGTVDLELDAGTTRLVHDEEQITGQTVIAYNSSSLTALLPFSQSYPGSAPPGIAINDVAAWPTQYNSSNGQTSLLAATNHGFYFAPNRNVSFVTLDGGNSNEPVLRPVSLPGVPGDGCSGAPAPELSRVRFLQGNNAYDNENLLAVTTANDALLYLWRPAPLTTDGTAACSQLADLSLVWGPCAPCGAGETLVDLGGNPLAETRSVETLCRGADGKLVRYQNVPADDGGVCPQVKLQIRESAAPGMTLQLGTTLVDGVDKIGMPLTCAGPECKGLLFDGIADRVVGNGDTLVVFPPPHIVNNGITQDDGSLLWKGVGLIPVTTNIYLAGGIDERPDLAITGNRSSGSDFDHDLRVSFLDQFVNPAPYVDNVAGVVARLRNSTDYMPAINGGFGLTGTEEIARGVVADDADGGHWLAVGVGDRIWAAPGADHLGQDGGIVDFDIKLVPLSFGRIQSLAMGPPTGGSAKGLLEGYAVVSQRLFRITVPSGQLWLSDEIRLADAVPLKVWREGSKGRVGTADGRVFGLPIPVQLAGAVDGGVALDFADLCGQGIALTPTGPYKLVATGGPEGKWEPIVFDTFPAANDLGATWVPPLHVSREGKLHKVVVMNKLGLVMQLSAQCGD